VSLSLLKTILLQVFSRWLLFHLVNGQSSLPVRIEKMSSPCASTLQIGGSSNSIQCGPFEV
jgi:hypothetical protein